VRGWTRKEGKSDEGKRREEERRRERKELRFTKEPWGEGTDRAFGGKAKT